MLRCGFASNNGKLNVKMLLSQIVPSQLDSTQKIFGIFVANTAGTNFEKHSTLAANGEYPVDGDELSGITQQKEVGFPEPD